MTEARELVASEDVELLRPPWYVRRLTLEAAAQAPLSPATPILVVDAPLAATEAELADLVATAGAPGLVVDLRGLAAGSPLDHLTAVYRLARVLEARGMVPARVAVATGDTTGAAAGAWKAVAREWVDEGLGTTTARVITATADVGRDAIVSEANNSGPVEVHLGTGQRQTSVLRRAPRTTPRVSADSVVLLIGGARGIVARMGEELVRRTGCRLVVVGRTVLDSSDTSSVGLDRSAARKAAKVALGPDATAKDINALVAKRGREAEVATNLARLEAAGAASVTYLSGDAAVPDSLTAIVAKARSLHGRLDLIVHGAGIDRSKRFTRKTETELQAVMAPKLGAIDVLTSAGAFLVGLGSVSARFGNAGQIDYAAANEELAAQVVGCGGLMVDFTAWADVGMAAPLAKAMRERGVDPLPSDEAARATADLIISGAPGEWVLSGRLPQTRPGLEPALVPSTDVLHVPGATLRREATLELDEHAWLLDHRSTAAGLMPGVMALAAMSASARCLAPWLDLSGFRDIAFEAPLKVFRGRPLKVTVGAERGARDDGGALAVSCRIDVGEALHHRCQVLLGGVGSTPKTGADVPPSMEPGPDAAEVYRTFFHGPSFRVLATTEIADGVIRATSTALDAAVGVGIPAPYRHLAMARELAFQAAGVYLMARERKVALPVGADKVTCCDAPRPGERVQAVAWIRATEPLFRFDVDLIGDDGRLLERLEGLSFRYLASL